MKKFTLIIMLAVLLLAACEKDPKKETVGIDRIELSKTDAALKPGETIVLTVTVYPENADKVVFEWSSSDPKVATVENGMVTAVAAGEAIVTVSAGGAKAVCAVVVKEAVNLPKAKVNDFYYSDGTWSSALDKNKKCIGIVFAVDFDRSSMRNPAATSEKPFPPYVHDPDKPDLKNLVVGLEDLGGLTAWDLSAQEIKTGATSWFNGYGNTNDPVVTDNLDQLPPMKRVLSLSSPEHDWYLPSGMELLELICVFNGQPSWVLGQTKSFLFEEGASEEQIYAAYQQQRDAFNARLVEAGGQKIYDVRPVLKWEGDVPEYTGDLSDGEAIDKWNEEVWDPWIEANPGYFDALAEKGKEAANLYYWSSTSMDKYAPDKDYYQSALSFSTVEPNFGIFSFKSNQYRVRAVLAF